jgi:hypothetical protein
MAVHEQLARSADPSHRALARAIREYNSDRPEA